MYAAPALALFVSAKKNQRREIGKNNSARRGRFGSMKFHQPQLRVGRRAVMMVFVTRDSHAFHEFKFLIVRQRVVFHVVGGPRSRRQTLHVVQRRGMRPARQPAIHSVLAPHRLFVAEFLARRER